MEIKQNTCNEKNGCDEFNSSGHIQVSTVAHKYKREKVKNQDHSIPEEILYI